MRKLFQTLGLITIILLVFASCQNQNNKTGDQFTVNLNIKNLKQDSKVILQRHEYGKWIKKDSVILKNGIGKLHGHVVGPTLYYLTLKKFNVYIPVWIENSNITVDADLQNLRHPIIKGSKSQEIGRAHV